jgi:hypothetical protein
LANTFLFPDGEKTVRMLQLVVSRFIDWIVRLILSPRVRPCAHTRFWFLEDSSDCIPFETMPAASTNDELVARLLPQVYENVSEKSWECACQKVPLVFSGGSRDVGEVRPTIRIPTIR